MSFKNKYIKIIDWAGKTLFHGEYDDSQVDIVLDANRCKCIEYIGIGSKTICPLCNNTGYIGDFHVEWEDEDGKEDCNVYEYINY